MNRLVRHVTPALALTLAVLAPAGQAATDAGRDAARLDPESLRVKYEKFVLPNGLTVVVHEDHVVPLVAVNLSYHVGSGSERPGRTGFAHLFEHFFFNGSEHYPHGFREAMDDLGANNRNGSTSTDLTNFVEDVPVGALERTLYLEADRMGFLAANISQEMLERERGVVSNEKRQGENQPYGRVFTRMVEALYPAAHPYSWSTIGSLDDLAAATLDDVKQWYATYYGPNNCTLTLAGDVTLARAKELAERYFGGIPPGPPLPRYGVWVPKLETDLHDTLQDRVPQARVYRAWHAPPWGEAELGQLNLLAGVLSGSKSARLDRRLVYEKELATQVSAGLWEKEISSDFIVQATVKPGVDPAAVEREIDAVVAELLDEGPTADELARSRTRTFAEVARAIERLGAFGGRAAVLAESQTFGGDPHFYVENLKRLAAATPADLVAAGRSWLSQPSYHLTVTPMPELAAGRSDVDRKILPALGAAADPSFPKVQRATLANGLELMLLERRSAPLVNAALAVDAGSASDAPEKAGVASLALGLLDDGTATRDLYAIEDGLDALGAFLTTDTGLDLSFVRLRALRPTFPQALEIFADVVRNPAFPPELVALEKKRRVQQIAQEKAQPVGSALRLAPPLLYGAGHPYGKPLSGSGYAAAVEAATREELAAWHRAWFKPGSATLVVTGAISMAELRPLVERALGGWAAGEAPAKSVAAPGAGVRGKVYLVDKKDAPQSVIVATHLSEPGGQPDDLAIEIAMRGFGGMATSRLNRNLRLEKHWSYGTSGQLVGARGARPLVVVAPVQTDKTKESMVEVASEIAGVAGARPIAGEELANLMQGTVSRLAGRFETLEALEAAAVAMVHLGYPESYFAEYAENARAIGESELTRAGNRYVKPDEVVWVVIGDLAEIEPGIRELGYGDIVRLDPDGKPLS